MITQKLEYSEGSDLFEAYIAHKESSKEKKPAILIFHAWSGRDLFACSKAEQLAELGYVGIAVDLYGKGQMGYTPNECMKLMGPLMEDRELLKKRILSALNAAQSLSYVDSTRIGAIGFCFGGLCAIDLARAGTEVKGIVSFHGLLKPPSVTSRQPISSKVLVLHGNDDPMVSQQERIAFEEEMSKRGADWQLHVFGNTVHSFTNPSAKDPSSGKVYNPLADTRSWGLMKSFFDEVMK